MTKNVCLPTGDSIPGRIFVVLAGLSAKPWWKSLYHPFNLTNEIEPVHCVNPLLQSISSIDLLGSLEFLSPGCRQQDMSGWLVRAETLHNASCYSTSLSELHYDALLVLKLCSLKLKCAKEPLLTWRRSSGDECELIKCSLSISWWKLARH